jgi:hypothetical protein
MKRLCGMGVVAPLALLLVLMIQPIQLVQAQTIQPVQATPIQGFQATPIQGFQATTIQGFQAPWSPTGSMNTARVSHAAVLLPNGKVLAAGGNTVNGTVASAELYDAATGTWSQTASMTTARYAPTATLLPNGTVLIAGGCAFSTCLASAELYDPTTGTWTPTGSMSTARGVHTATLLSNGKVLVAAGLAINGGFVGTAELYDPAAGTWSSAGALTTARVGPKAVLLKDGRVLVTGGLAICCYVGTATAELYDPATNSWTAAGSMGTARYDHVAALLPSGKVLVAGGQSSNLVAPTNSAEVYDPIADTWSATGSMSSARNQSFTATPLPTGDVVVAGGDSAGTSEVYSPTAGTWSTLLVMTTARVRHTATLLSNGQVLVTGGGDSTGATLASAELSGTATTPSAAISIQPPTAQVTQGATTTEDVQAAITGGNLGAWTVDVTYDPTQLQPTGCTSSATVASVCNTAFSATKVRVTGANASGLTGTQSLASITFKAIGSVPGATTSLTPTVVTLTDNLGNPLTSTVSAAQLTLIANTTTTLASSANPAVSGQPVTLTASVASGATPVSTGSVTFQEGTTVLAPPTPVDVSGQVSFTTAALPVGTHTIVATYSSSSSAFNPSSATLTETVNKASTTSSVVSSAIASGYGQPVTFTVNVAAVAPGAGTPTGSVTFQDGLTSLGIAASLTGGSAQLTTSALAAGSHTITAVYSGDPNFNASTSSALVETVNQASTTTAVSSSKNPSIVGDPLTFTAQVSPATATGTVQFQIDNTNVGSPVPLSAGTATSPSISTLAFGNHAVTAVYAGDANYSTSTGTLSGGQQVNGLPGDVNLDGQVNSVDALCILRNVAGLAFTTACPQEPAAIFDVDRSGTVDSIDALCVLRAVAAGVSVTTICPPPFIAAALQPVTAPATTASPATSTTSSPSVAATGAPAGGAGGTPKPSAQVSVQPSSVLVARGASTTVQVQASATAGLGAWTVDVTYDPTLVKVTGCTPSVGSAVCNPAFAPNTIRITGASATALSGPQTLAKVTFTAVGASGSSSTVGLAVKTFATATGAPLSPTISTGKIRIK